MNSRALLFFSLLLLLCSVLAGYYGYRTTTEAQQQARLAQVDADTARAELLNPDRHGEPVVVVVRDVPAYQRLEADDVVVDHLVRKPPYAYSRLDEVVGQVPQTSLLTGEILSKGHLDPGSEIARLLKPGERGVAIPIDEVIGGGGFVQPGDSVDVLMFVQGESRAAASSQVVMRAMRVVGMGSRVLSPEGQAPATDGKQQAMAQARTAVIAVTESEATRLLLASSIGVLRLAIRPAVETLQGCDAAEQGPCLAAQSLRPGKTDGSSNRLIRAGNLVNVGSSSTPVSATTRAASGNVPAAQPVPRLQIYRGLDRSAYP